MALNSLFRHAVVDELLQFPQGGPQGELPGRVRHGPNPHLEDLLTAADVDRRNQQARSAGEVLDVGVVAVVQPAGLANHLVQMAALVAMLAEPGVGQGQGVPLLRATEHVDGKARC